MVGTHPQVTAVYAVHAVQERSPSTSTRGNRTCRYRVRFTFLSILYDSYHRTEIGTDPIPSPTLGLQYLLDIDRASA